MSEVEVEKPTAMEDVKLDGQTEKSGNVPNSTTEAADSVKSEPSAVPTESNNNASSSSPKVDASGDNKVSEKIAVKGKDIDDVVPSYEWITTKRDAAVRLRMQDTGPLAEKPITIPSMMYATVQRVPDLMALAVKRGGVWKKWTYREYYTEVKNAAKSFIKLGLEPYHGVGIIGFNSPEWFFSDLGAIFAGGFATGIYTTNSPEACEYVASNCEANIIVVENNVQLKKILKVWSNLPHLKAVVQYTGEVAEKRDNVYSWEEFMKFSNEVTDEQLQERLSLLAPNKACTLIYTSGTTGNPKGVMLSHDNMTWTANIIGKHLKQVFGQEVALSYLPLSHIAAQMLDLIIPLTVGGTTYFAQPDALKGSLLGTLQEVRPTGFLGVPRVWEKLEEGMKEKGKTRGSVARQLAAWARKKGTLATHAQMNNESLPFGYTFANLAVFKRVKKVLGLDRCRMCVSGAAPITKETLDFFYSLNIPLHEVYGMSESTGPQTVGVPESFRIYSVGKEFPGATTKFADVDADGNGEICMNGRHVFMGYLGEEEKTKDAFDKDFWLLTGDIGKKDKDGFLYITGRKKELLITAGGENVAPVPVEEVVKECLPCVSNCMLIGDKRKFLSMLITLKVNVNPDSGEPMDDLTQAAIDWCKAQGSESTKVSQIVDSKDTVVLKAIQEGVDKANERSTSRAQKIQKWSLLPRDFSIPGGELGPTMKLRRPIVQKMYSKTIDAFYDS